MENKRQKSMAFYRWIAGSALVIATIAVYISFDYKERLLDSYERTDFLVGVTDSLLDRQEEARAKQPSIPRINKYEFNRLESKGIQNPETAIADKLRENPDLIPFEGQLGGNMGFYAPENIFVMNDKWVFAYFEDGHVAGNMLLRFNVSDEGELSWEVLDAYLDE